MHETMPGSQTVKPEKVLWFFLAGVYALEAPITIFGV
jgi:hypothetical protein